MNNEIGRKITSLTLMTIMLAGGMTVASSGMMPAAFAANANLFVSAENSQFDNYMSGPQVIEVVVIDSDINDTDEAKGEPDVTVNGNILRMIQGVDGNWYGYFADRTMAITADATVTTAGSGIDFGTLCTAADAEATWGASFDDTVGVFANTDNCTNPATNSSMNVVREAKDPSNGLNDATVFGQILNQNASGAYPLIQLYTLNPTGNVVVQYNKGGGAQSVTLTFDTVDEFAGAELDRAVYPQGAQVHATITDLWLNIDPTDEDSWTFGTVTNVTSNYQVFDENGQAVGNNTGNTDTNLLTSQLSNLMCEDNCVLEIDFDAQDTGDVLTIQDNADSFIVLSVNVAGCTANDHTCFAVTNGTTSPGFLNATAPVTITEQGPNSGVFGTYDESDKSVLKVLDGAKRGTSASFDYNESPVTVLVGHNFATVNISPTDDEWNSGEEIPIIIVDGDANLNSRSDEDLDLFNADIPLIPSLRTGDPFTLAENDETDGAVLNVTFNTVIGNIDATENLNFTLAGVNTMTDAAVDKFSKRAIINGTTGIDDIATVIIDLDATAADLQETFLDTRSSAANKLFGYNLYNQDLTSFNSTMTWNVYLLNNSADVVSNAGIVAINTTAKWIVNATDSQSLSLLNGTTQTSDFDSLITWVSTMDGTDNLALLIESADANTFDITAGENEAIVADFFSFGFTDDGLETSERVANQLIRIEAEESGDNTSSFEGTLEYTMVNQLNILDADLYTGLSMIADDPNFIVIEDLTDEDAPRVNYNDLGADGVTTQVSDQEEAPSHSGIVSFDSDSYKNADTVVVTVEDLDLNVDSDLIDIYTVVSTPAGDVAIDTVGEAGLPSFTGFGDLGRMLDITFDDTKWQTFTGNDECTPLASDSGLAASGFTLVETGPSSGILVGDFQIPSDYCSSATATAESVTGLDIEVNYVDFRDASGEVIEVGDSAGVRANTGSVSLDRTVYPVPFGNPADFDDGDSDNSPTGRSVFPVHQTGMSLPAGLDDGEFLQNGDLTIHVRVNDPDFDTSASGEDSIAQSISDPAPNDDFVITNTGLVKISVLRGADSVVLGYAAGPSATAGLLDNGDDEKNTDAIRQFGPMDEIAPDAGIFEADIDITFTDGPADNTCPNNVSYDTLVNADADAATDEAEDRFTVDNGYTGEDFCILQGDILQVEYSDPADASGDLNTVTDSATFDLRNGVLQSDKSVYIIGSDMIMTLIEPDLDLDNDRAETYDLDLIEWDSDAATITMGDLGGDASNSGNDFDPEPSNFRETGDSTGIFQIVIEIPQALDNDNLERGEEIVLEYTDWGPSGSDFVGDEDEDVNLTIFTSNFGATVELDQKVYTWTDKVYMTVVAPDHNFDGDLVDEIGNTDLDPLKVSTRGFDLDNYKLVETGTDTGIFTGEVILTGFEHDADGDIGTGDSTTGSDTNPTTEGAGPTSGFLQTDDDDGLTVSFEFSEDETVVGSALIRWNIGEVQWLEASYPASGTGVVRVIDPDMNLDPEAVDNYDVDVWSDSDAGGIDLTVTETNEATGIFEGTVFFTTTDESSGHRLRVAEGDTVTAEYEDNTLPDPYTTADELDITATTLIGTVVPPLERAPAANLRTVDAFGNSLDTVSVDQQVQISADLANGQDREQQFAYLVQIQDGNGVTVSLAWITGSLSAGQSFSPALSWIPTQAGTYTATAFVWESVDNPTALSPPVSTTVTVQ